MSNTQNANRDAHQLSLDFSNIPNRHRHDFESVKRHVREVSPKRTEYHAEASEIGSSTFAIKLSYMGRSFLVKGGYRKEVLRSYSDPTYSSAVIRGIRLDVISVFRNGRYNPESLPRRDHEVIEKQVTGIISSPLHNAYLWQSEVTY